MIKTLAPRLLLIAVVSGLFVSVGPVPAQAAYSECPVNWVCLWNNPGGINLILVAARSPGTCHNITGYANDSADSFYNHLTPTPASGRHVQFYRGANCTGALLRTHAWQGNNPLPYPPGRYANFLLGGAGRADINDRNEASSIYFNIG